jgi:uncharacterized protein (DUF362 family)
MTLPPNPDSSVSLPQSATETRSAPSAPSIYLGSRMEPFGMENILAALEWIGFPAACRPDSRVFVKANLTYPSFRPGVTTSPEFLGLLLEALKQFTSHLFIGDSDSGGYNRFSAETVFQSAGLYAVAKRYGAMVVNLSEGQRRAIRIRRGSRSEALDLPALLTDEIDFLTSVPVPKVHMYTGVSLSIKNLWGCIPSNRDRLRLHPWLEQILPQIVPAVRARFAIVDGKFGLNRSGPLRGDPVELGWFLAADDLFGADRTACDVLQVDWRRITHLSPGGKGARPEHVPPRINLDPASLRSEKFFLRLDPTDLPGWLAFRIPWIAWLAYFSPASSLLHRLLYLFRKPFYDYTGKRLPPHDGERER